MISKFLIVKYFYQKIQESKIHAINVPNRKDSIHVPKHTTIMQIYYHILLCMLIAKASAEYMSIFQKVLHFL